MLEAEAKERQKAGGGDKKSGVEIIPPPIENPGKARGQAAKLTGTNPRYVSDAKKLKTDWPSSCYNTPMPRYSLKTLLIVVALAAVCAWLGERHIRFKGIAALYTEDAATQYVCDQYPSYWATSFVGWHNSEYMNPDDKAGISAIYAHYRAMHTKYQRAARYPWLPVEPDTPMPEKTATN